MFQQAYYKLPPLVSASFSSHAILFPKKKSHRRLAGRFYRRRLRRIQTVENAAGWHDEVVTEGERKIHAFGIFRTTTA